MDAADWYNFYRGCSRACRQRGGSDVLEAPAIGARAAGPRHQEASMLQLYEHPFSSSCQKALIGAALEVRFMDC